MTEPLFTFEVGVYRNDEEPEFELRMRYQDRIVLWSGKTPVDFGGQYTDAPYEPSTPLTADDLTWALNRAGWHTLGNWGADPTDPGYLSVKAAPTEFAVPQVVLPPAVLAGLP